ncbi:MAG: 50S ribosomal protein L30 [Candidatus Aenigmarchaeota archaeon]|nr:50S ribosomal protein L30 [Candidatus Aenigmarchaeota archaeon]
MFAIIRIRGSINLRDEVNDTFKMMRMNRKMHCVVLKETDIVKGMLQKVKDWSTWGEVDDKVLSHLVSKRARKNGNVRLTKQEAEAAVKSLKDTGKLPEGIKPVFRLSPPSKGFKKSIKQHYPGGELGYRGKEINALLKRMI